MKLFKFTFPRKVCSRPVLVVPDRHIMANGEAIDVWLLTKREVKMTGYWPSSFFACLWTETKSRSINTQKKNEANIQSS